VQKSTFLRKEGYLNQRFCSYQASEPAIQDLGPL
jgi:hypothetical protein